METEIKIKRKKRRERNLHAKKLRTNDYYRARRIESKNKRKKRFNKRDILEDVLASDLENYDE